MSTMRVQLALYKGPPQRDLKHTISHFAIRLWTWSRWSHAELVIDGVCYSSSSRDGGVRAKTIDLNSGRWDAVDIALSDVQVAQALAWFLVNDGDRYDWAGVWRFVIPLLPQSESRWFCFESIGSALGFAGPHKLTANDLYAWAVERPAAPVLQQPEWA